MLSEVKHSEELQDDTAVDIEFFCKAVGQNLQKRVKGLLLAVRSQARRNQGKQ